MPTNNERRTGVPAMTDDESNTSMILDQCLIDLIASAYVIYSLVELCFVFFLENVYMPVGAKIESQHSSNSYT